MRTADSVDHQRVSAAHHPQQQIVTLPRRFGKSVATK